MIRIVFMGTPEFAVPSLVALINQPDYEIVAVVTQPDRRQGRSKKLTPLPIKVTALGAGLTVQRPLTGSRSNGSLTLQIDKGNL